MKGVPDDREQAAQLFVRMLTHAVYDGVVSAVLRELHNGPGGRKPPPGLVRLHAWFQSMDGHGRQMAVRLIQYTADLSVFHFLALLDGLTGTFHQDGHVLDLALYLETHEESEYRPGRAPKRSIRINPVLQGYEDLHDMYRELIASRRAAGDYQTWDADETEP